jgi:putative hydrolase of the HAD superfamily
MSQIKAIGFDLFNTLLTVDPSALDEGLDRLTASLAMSGFKAEKTSFKDSYRESALKCMHETRRDGRETHNRFWISAALLNQGYKVEPDDHRIAEAVNAYFSAFMGSCQLIPGTMDMLETLKGTYRLGLLSNFTHPPALWEIINSLGLATRFTTILISGELGYRKPHPLVFQELVRKLGVKKDQMLYIGDDPEPDIDGARQSGIKPVWFTYVRDKKIPLAPSITGTVFQEPLGDFVRISEWADLLCLLDKALS